MMRPKESLMQPTRLGGVFLLLTWGAPIGVILPQQVSNREHMPAPPVPENLKPGEGCGGAWHASQRGDCLDS